MTPSWTTARGSSSTSLPITIVNNLWIYKIKSDTDSAVTHYKAGFMAKGCSQRAGLDYT
jgi:hypothetical protein